MTAVCCGDATLHRELSGTEGGPSTTRAPRGSCSFGHLKKPGLNSRMHVKGQIRFWMPMGVGVKTGARGQSAQWLAKACACAWACVHVHVMGACVHGRVRACAWVRAWARVHVHVMGACVHGRMCARVHGAAGAPLQRRTRTREGRAVSGSPLGAWHRVEAERPFPVCQGRLQSALLGVTWAYVRAAAAATSAPRPAAPRLSSACARVSASADLRMGLGCEPRARGRPLPREESRSPS